MDAVRAKEGFDEFEACWRAEHPDALDSTFLLAAEIWYHGDIKSYVKSLRVKKERNVIVYDSDYTCKCGSNNVQEVTAQLRGADEGQDLVCSCQKCGIVWVIRN